jgi:hypothetical protein
MPAYFSEAPENCRAMPEMPCHSLPFFGMTRPPYVTAGVGNRARVNRRRYAHLAKQSLLVQVSSDHRKGTSQRLGSRVHFKNNYPKPADEDFPGFSSRYLGPVDDLSKLEISGNDAVSF